MYYGAANRDPDVFHDPDKMDMHRNNVQDHLAFGTGPHVCLGQRIANMQLETAYRRILDRFPNIEWTGKQSHAPNNFVNAISGLEVDLGIN
jgi:cytochrome P450